MDPSETDLARITKWFALSRKYVEYYDRGGEGFLRDFAMQALDLDAVGPRLPPRKPAALEHEWIRAPQANWRLLRGKKGAEDSTDE